ncbi:hypothetical protein DFH06DRAFT_1468676 [Mycena polygramma]|nr:hypothetical protein DFH06DRAFT_1468676 [Mycena polygramma]
MADRSKREVTTARPGKVVNDAKQRRRTREEIDRDDALKAQAKEEKEKAAAEKKRKGVKAVAAKEQEMQAEDDRARGSAARPDLRSTELKRRLMEKAQQDRETSPDDLSATAAPPSTAATSPGTFFDTAMSGVGDGVDPMDDGDDSDRDPDYTMPEGEVDSSVDDNDADEEDAGQEDDLDIAAKLAEYEKKLRAQAKGKEKARSKPQKGTLREEIQGARGVPPGSTKRKAVDAAEPPEPAKKPKAAAGGLRTDWQKNVGVEKLPKKSSTTWRRSVSSRGSSISATSEPSAVSSTGVLPSGEFDQDEGESSLQAARAAHSAKGHGAGSSATKKMGITLTKKNVAVDVDGKPQREKKRRYKNADLPFPADGYHADLRHYHSTVVCDMLDWAAHLRDPFAATNHPDFKPTVQNVWATYFGAYKITDAVGYLAGALIVNWRSNIGKRCVKVVTDELNALPSTTRRREWVAEQLDDLTFLYRNPVTQTGSYRSDLFLRVFGSAHLRFVLKNERSYGFPIGAASLVAAGLERALTLCKNGSLSTDGVPRRGRKTAQSFVAVPWAERAASYLLSIDTLTPAKWQEIMSLASEFVNSKDGSPADPFDASTDGDSTDGYDPRANVVVSDDEPEDDAEEDSGGPSRLDDVPADSEAP